jgi:hypothetical protein
VPGAVPDDSPGRLSPTRQLYKAQLHCLHFALNEQAYEITMRGTDWPRLFRKLDKVSPLPHLH